MSRLFSWMRFGLAQATHEFRSVFVFALIVVVAPLSCQHGECSSLRQIMKLAEEGKAIAQWQLAILYAEGQGVPKDYQKALKWYRKAANQGLAGAQRGLGIMYAEGKGVKRDLKQAVKWIRKAAEQGDTNSQCDLGLMYAGMRGDKNSPKEAGKWYRKAAEKGAICGQRNLGVMYQMGTCGVDSDPVKAVEWFRRAAEQGDAESQFYLGQMYDSPLLGLKEDRAEAKKWYRRAAKQAGMFAVFAKSNLERLEKRPTPSVEKRKGKEATPREKVTDTREARSQIFQKAFPAYGKEEFSLANDDLFPDWKRRISPNGTWSQFLEVYGEFIDWWTKAGSPPEPGVKLWNRFMDTKKERRSWIQQEQKNQPIGPYTVAFDVEDNTVSVRVSRDNTTVHIRKISWNRAELENRVGKFLSSFRLPELNKESLADFNPHRGKALYTELLSHVLKDVPRGAHLIIDQHPIVAGLPFEALVVQGKAQWVETEDGWPRVSGLTYLGDIYQISYAGPVDSPKNRSPCEKPDGRGDRILVMADPVFSADDPRLGAVQRRKKQELLQRLHPQLMGLKDETRIVFPRLPRTGSLVESLKKIAIGGTDLYTGMAASKRTLFGIDLCQYTMMVFATHGYFGKDMLGVLEPVMVLTLLNQPRGQDGFLRPSEVRQLKLGADLVVLLGCDTALGDFVPGKGIASMSNAFLTAGAKSVLAKVLCAADKPSVMLTESFFKHLRDGKTKLEALRLAKDHIRSAGYDHPFFWAPFVLVGEVN